MIEVCTNGPLVKTRSVRVSTARFDFLVIYEKKINVVAERERLQKRIGEDRKGNGQWPASISNEQFLAKAPAQVVEGIRKRAQELAVLQRKRKSKLDALGCNGSQSQWQLSGQG